MQQCLSKWVLYYLSKQECATSWGKLSKQEHAKSVQDAEDCLNATKKSKEPSKHQQKVEKRAQRVRLFIHMDFFMQFIVYKYSLIKNNYKVILRYL